MSLPGQIVDPNPPANLAAAALRSDNAFYFCLEVTCNVPMASWFPIGGAAYMHPQGDFSGVYNPDKVDEIIGVTVNGVALTAAASVPAVATTPGTFFWDGVANQCLVISMPDSSNPQARGVTVVATARYRFSDGPNDTAGFRWRPWLVTPSTLTRQVTPDFSGITQVGSGAYVLQNENHFFDTRRGQNWGAGRCTLSVIPAGVAGSPTLLCTHAISSVKMTDKDFTLAVQDPKVLVDTYYPTELYSSTTYPAMDQSAIGNVVPVAYGKILDITPVCIDTANAIFKVAGHPITSFDGVRVQDPTTGLWTVINFLTKDLSTAQFSLNPSDWNFSSGQQVAVDFSGKPDANGFLMANPADIAADLITALGQPINSAGFAAARARYDVGYTGNNPNRRVTVHAPSLYLDSQSTALTVLEEMMVNVRAYLQTAPDGTLTMTPFRTYAISDLPVINDNNALGAGLVVDGSGTSSQFVQAGQKVTEAQVTFNNRPTSGTVQTVIVDYLPNQYKNNLPSPGVEPVDSLFTSQDDALYLAQCLAAEYTVDPTVWSVELKWLAWTWMPGQHVRCYFPRHCIDLVCEVLQVSFDVAARKCALTLGNLRGFEMCGGFWANSTDVSPAGNPLTWPTAGEANAADAQDARYIRLQVGHWHASNNFALDTTAPGATWSDLDSVVSGWK